MKSPYLALDIGGANIKAGDGTGRCRHLPFALWKHQQDLPKAISQIASEFPLASEFAITMTGELADCFQSKQEGVRYIVSSAQRALADRMVIYGLNGEFVSPEQARSEPLLVAAANWHALASFAWRFATRHEAIILIDIGSTTTDLIPVVDGKVAARGQTDFTRLVHGELIYTGVERSFVNGIVRCVSHRGEKCHVMNECFATSLDVATILGQIPENSGNLATADGRSQTITNARARLARVIGKDVDDFDVKDAVEMAQQVQRCQIELVGKPLSRIVQRLGARNVRFVISGQGEFLAQLVINNWNHELLKPLPTISLNDRLGASVSEAAPAHAVAILLAEQKQKNLPHRGDALLTAPRNQSG